MSKKKITIRGLESASGPKVDIRKDEIKDLPEDLALPLLNAGHAEVVKDAGEEAVSDKDTLIERAVALDIAPPSKLKQWSVKRLEKAITEAEE
jgi:hypothetical protein